MMLWWLVACAGPPPAWTEEAVLGRTLSALPDGAAARVDGREALGEVLRTQDPLTFDGDARRSTTPERRRRKGRIWAQQRLRERRDVLLWLRAEAGYAGIAALPSDEAVLAAAESDEAATALARELVGQLGW